MPAPTQAPHRQLTLYSGGGCCQSSLQGGLNLQLPVTPRTRNITEGFVETHRVSPPQTTYRRGVAVNLVCTQTESSTGRR